MKALFKSHLLIGDGLYISEPLRAWIRQHRDWDITIQTLPDHIQYLYQGMVRDMKSINIVYNRPDEHFDFEFNFDVGTAFQLSDKKRQHLAQSYADMLGVTIDDVGPTFIPSWFFEPKEAEETKKLFGCILVSMFSASDASRGNPPGPPNKMLPWEKWIPLLALLRKEYPTTLIRFLGAPTDMVPNGYAEGIVEPGEYMLGIPLNKLAVIMKKAKLLVTIDNGMSHLAASQQCPTFLMYPRCLLPHYILPVGNRRLTWIHMDPVRVQAEHVRMALAHCIKTMKAREKAEGISATVASTLEK